MSEIPVENPEKVSREEFVISLPQVLDPVRTTESIVATALEVSTRKMGLSNTGTLISSLKQGEAAAFNYYCYHIAKELGSVLGSWSKNIKAIYTCNYDEAVIEEDDFGNMRNFFLIHMIIWAEQKNKALNALLDAMDAAMVQQHQHMLGQNQLKSILDAQVIDDEDVRNRTGYAALLNSIFQPPIQVWGKNSFKHNVS
ncbi:MAG: hypothetical protein PHU23_03745 [Dehalococcoidales bacterium]|nr:hypothetical protein [Dehalococcoidales bacterium]